MSEQLATPTKKGLLSPGLYALLKSAAQTGVAQSFTGLQTFLAGILLTPLATDPASPAEGQLWSRSGQGFFGQSSGTTIQLSDTTTEANRAFYGNFYG